MNLNENIVDRVLSRSDYIRVKSLLNSTRDTLIFSILHELGLTISEIVDLKVLQIDFKNNTLNLPNRVISISESLINEINTYMHKVSPTKYLFFSRQSPQITPRRIQQVLKNVSNILGYKLTPSLLRKQVVARMIYEGKSSSEIKDFSGLKQVSTKYYLDNLEYKLLLENITDDRDRLLVSFIYETGISAKQIVDLTFSDVFNKTRKLRIKLDERYGTSKFRFVNLSTTLIKSITNFKEKYNLRLTNNLFYNSQNNPLTDRRIRQLILDIGTKYSFNNNFNYSALVNSFIFNVLDSKSIKDSESELGFIDLRSYYYDKSNFSKLHHVESPKKIKGGENNA